MADPASEERPLQWPADWSWTDEPPPGHGDRADRRWGVLTHLSVVPLVVPLLVVLGRGSRSPYVGHSALEALNFQITWSLAVLLCSLLSAVVVGLLLLPLVVLSGVVLPVRAALAARRGAWYRYPLTLRVLT